MFIFFSWAIIAGLYLISTIEGQKHKEGFHLKRTSIIFGFILFKNKELNTEIVRQLQLIVYKHVWIFVPSAVNYTE